MSFWKTVSATLAVMALAVLVLPSLTSAQGAKMGYVQDERIKEEYKPWQRAQETWETENRAWEDEAVTMETELQDLITEFEKQKLILSPDKKAEREAAINSKREALDAFTKQIYGPGGTAERKYASLVQPLLESISRAIEEVAVEENYDVVFTLQSGLGYIRESLDITDKVLRKLEEME